MYIAKLKKKDESIIKLKKEKEEAISNSQMTMKDTINIWKTKEEENKQLLERTTNLLHEKDEYIESLKEQMENDTIMAQMEKETKELRVIIGKMENEVCKLNEERDKYMTKTQELTEKNSHLEIQLRIKTKSKDCSEKENQWHSHSMKLKAEIEKLKKEKARLESEKAQLGLENNMLNGHLTANQKIRLLQKIKEENNCYRAENYKLKEEGKNIREKLARVEKDLQYLQAKHKGYELPSKYEMRIEELEEKIKKEFDVSMQLCKLPELASLNIEERCKEEPIDQISEALEYLIKNLRVCYMLIQ